MEPEYPNSQKPPSSHPAENDRDRVLDAPDPYVREWTWNGHTWRVEVPKGFAFRGTTTPLPRTLISLFWGRNALEADYLAHDYAWKVPRFYKDGELVEGQRMPKAATDAIFLSGNDNRMLRVLVWAAVTALGWPVWWDWHERIAGWVRQMWGNTGGQVFQ
jgi:hypothetical protein